MTLSRGIKRKYRKVTTCKDCGVELTSTNWGSGNQSKRFYTCRKCDSNRAAMKRERVVVKMGHGDQTRVYYTYELYSILSNGEHYTFYIGKGKGNRMYDHEKLYRRKLKNPRSLLDPKEKMMLFLEDHGFTIYTGILRSGMTEDEAFNLEAEYINSIGLQYLTNVAYPRRLRVVYV